MKTEWRAVGMTFFAALLVLNVKLAFMAAGTLVRRIPEISKCQKCNENIWRCVIFKKSLGQYRSLLTLLVNKLRSCMYKHLISHC